MQRSAHNKADIVGRILSPSKRVSFSLCEILPKTVHARPQEQEFESLSLCLMSVSRVGAIFCLELNLHIARPLPPSALLCPAHTTLADVTLVGSVFALGDFGPRRGASSGGSLGRQTGDTFRHRVRAPFWCPSSIPSRLHDAEPCTVVSIEEATRHAALG